MIVKARSGLITITDAAKELGVSRKTYYEWEKKAFEAMTTSLTDSQAGRSSIRSDSEKEELKAKLAESEREVEVLKARVQIHEIMTGNPVPRKGAGSSRSKKKRPRPVERNEKRERQGDREGDQGVPGENGNLIPGAMPVDPAALRNLDALAREIAGVPGADHGARPEEDGAA